MMTDKGVTNISIDNVYPIIKEKKTVPSGVSTNFQYTVQIPK